MSWQSIEPLLKKIRIEANPDNHPVSVVSVPPPLTVVGQVPMRWWFAIPISAVGV